MELLEIIGISFTITAAIAATAIFPKTMLAIGLVAIVMYVS